MSIHINPRKQITNQEIVIQEEPEETSEIEEYISFQREEQPLKKMGEPAHMPRQYNSEALKINKQKLLRYEPLKEKNRYVNKQPQNIHNANEQRSIQSSSFRKSNSIKVLKQIKHKVQVCGKRLKTCYDKQNDLQHFLPKMPSRMLQQSNNKMNKTYSAINFSKLNENNLNVTQELQQSKKTYVESRLKLENLPSNFKKGSQDDIKLNSHRSHGKLSRTFNKTTSLSKFSTNNDISYSHSDIMAILTKMNEKQEQLLEQKIYLQQRIAALREGIQKENALIVEINKNKQRMSTCLARKEAESKHSTNGAKLSKKKNQNFQTQTKDMEWKLQETANNNKKILQSIQEERELIRMYQLVIEEVKSQLKTQKKQKLQIQKKLAIMKKNQKSLHSKLCNHQSNNKQILRKIYHSLQKWQ